MDKKMLNRINELAKKKKAEGLTPEELSEQKQLYKIYLGEIREQFNATLDNVSVEEADGSVVPFKSAFKSRSSTSTRNSWSSTSTRNSDR